MDLARSQVSLFEDSIIHDMGAIFYYFPHNLGSNFCKAKRPAWKVTICLDDYWKVVLFLACFMKYFKVTTAIVEKSLFYFMNPAQCQRSIGTMGSSTFTGFFMVMVNHCSTSWFCPFPVYWKRRVTTHMDLPRCFYSSIWVINDDASWKEFHMASLDPNKSSTWFVLFGSYWWIESFIAQLMTYERQSIHLPLLGEICRATSNPY